MILVTVGTNEATFDRLLRCVAGFPAGEEVVVQHGPSRVRPPGAVLVESMPFDVLVDHVRRARVVVTHAGVGSIVVCLTNGKHPIVVPRRRRYGEAVDDHQVPLCERLGRAGLVTVVDDPAELAEVVTRTLPAREAAPALGATRLSDELGAALAEIAGPPGLVVA